MYQVDSLQLLLLLFPTILSPRISDSRFKNAPFLSLGDSHLGGIGWRMIRHFKLKGSHGPSDDGLAWTTGGGFPAEWLNFKWTLGGWRIPTKLWTEKSQSTQLVRLWMTRCFLFNQQSCIMMWQHGVWACNSYEVRWQLDYDLYKTSWEWRQLLCNYDIHSYTVCFCIHQNTR